MKILTVDREKQHVTNKGTTNDSNDCRFLIRNYEEKTAEHLYSTQRKQLFKQHCSTEFQGLGMSKEIKGLHPAQGPF